MTIRFGGAALLLLSLGACSAYAPGSGEGRSAGSAHRPTTRDELIASAMSAAPNAISKDATIVSMTTTGGVMEMQGLRVGTNGWTCYPDTPSPGPDPMCVDANGTEWANAWMHRGVPPPGKVGLGYRLMGGSDPSATDPFATEPKPGQPWINSGPQALIVNIGNQFNGYPTTPADPTRPFIMFAGTPYAFLVVPVK